MVTYGFKRNKLFRRFSFYQSRQESLNWYPSGHNPVQGQKQHELICLHCAINQVSNEQERQLPIIRTVIPYDSHPQFA